MGDATNSVQNWDYQERAIDNPTMNLEFAAYSREAAARLLNSRDGVRSRDHIGPMILLLIDDYPVALVEQIAYFDQDHWLIRRMMYEFFMGAGHACTLEEVIPKSRVKLIWTSPDGSSRVDVFTGEPYEALKVDEETARKGHEFWARGPLAANQADYDDRLSKSNQCLVRHCQSVPRPNPETAPLHMAEALIIEGYNSFAQSCRSGHQLGHCVNLSVDGQDVSFDNYWHEGRNFVINRIVVDPPIPKDLPDGESHPYDKISVATDTIAEDRVKIVVQAPGGGDIGVQVWPTEPAPTA